MSGFRTLWMVDHVVVQDVRARVGTSKRLCLLLRREDMDAAALIVLIDAHDAVDYYHRFLLLGECRPLPGALLSRP